MKTIGWDRRLSVSAGGRGLVGHAGAVLLRVCADKTGLTSALSAVMPGSEAADWWDRGVTLVGTAVAIVLGAACMSDVERLWAQQAAVFGVPDNPTGGSAGQSLGTKFRTLQGAGDRDRRAVRCDPPELLEGPLVRLTGVFHPTAGQLL